MSINKNAREKELQKLRRAEARFLEKRRAKKDTFLNQKLSDKVPEKLQSTLDAAFAKAFAVVFEKGTGVIEKTYKKENLEQNYQVNSYAVNLSESRKNLKAFSKGAKGRGNRNLLISGASGIGLGILGIGIPDIPLFTAMILKNVYEIALSYGYDYDSEEERYFILLLIAGAVSYGDTLDQVNDDVDRYILEGTLPPDYDSDVQVRQTSANLSKELLYMKFLQGIPIVGAAGGLYDAVYMRRITQYANMKYKMRFLLSS